MEAEQKAEKGGGRAAGVYNDMFSIACRSVEVAHIAKRRKECLRMVRKS